MRVALLLAALSTLAAAAPKRILYITHTAGFRHGSIETSARVMAEVAARTGVLEIVHTEDLESLSPNNLRGFDAIFFFTSGELPLSDEQKAALLDFVRGGKGFGGAHSATDTLYNWPEYDDLIGAYFDGHPWTQEAGIDVEDSEHPASRALAPSFRILEEFYQFRAFSRDNVRVLMTLDTSTVDANAAGVNRADADFALAWVKPYGTGRVFYTALGHFDETWLDSRFQKMLEGALLWLTGEADGVSTPRRPAPRIARVANLGAAEDETITAGGYVVVSGDDLTGGSTMVGAARPTKLAGARLLLNATPLPLVLATPKAIVAELPAALPEGDAADIEIVSGSVERSAPRRVTLRRPSAQ